MVKYRMRLRRRWLALRPALCAALCVVVGLGCALGWIFCTQQTVYITDEKGCETVQIISSADPQRMLRRQGLTLGPYDSFTFEQSEQGGRLHVEYGWDVTVYADGETWELAMHGGTVADALQHAGLTPGPDDRVMPALDQPLTDGCEIKLARVEYKEFTREEVLEPTTEYVESSLLYRQQSKVITRQTPSEGLARRTYRQTIVDGEVESEELTAEEILTPVQNEILVVYGEGAPVSSVDGPPVVDGVPEGYVQVLSGRATGYTASATAMGASGQGLYYGTCAVDPAVIPYGTKMYIASADGRFIYGYAYATDTGTAMREGRVLVDLFYETYDESAANAVIAVNVYIMPNGE